MPDIFTRLCHLLSESDVCNLMLAMYVNDIPQQSKALWDVRRISDRKGGPRVSQVVHGEA